MEGVNEISLYTFRIEKHLNQTVDNNFMKNYKNVVVFLIFVGVDVL